MKQLLIIGILAVCLISCDIEDDVQSPAIIAGLPSMHDVADSLNALSAHSVKWSIADSHVIYAKPVEVDWNKEFQVFWQTNINQQRFADAYATTDEKVGNTRTVHFVAKESSQELREVYIRLRQNQIIEYRIELDRSNLLSTSARTYHYHNGDYSISIDQSFGGFFKNHQYVHGTVIPDGSIWRGVFDLNGAKMPFTFFIKGDEQQTLLTKNGEEMIAFSFTAKNDGVSVFESNYFRTRFELTFINDSTINGQWISEQYDEPRVLPLRAKKNVPFRFKVDKLSSLNLTGAHFAQFFDQNVAPSDSTILMLNQEQHRVTGSFLTTTGDYRYLEGVVRNDSLFLSTMDGSHVFYFEAKNKGGELYGNFRSGSHWEQPWTAKLNADYNLKDAEQITAVKADSALHFEYPDQDGNMISLQNSIFHDRPVIISIMGTWCPNCVDEALFLKECRTLYDEQALAIVSLDYELITDSTRAFENIQKHRDGLGITYPVLLAGVGTSKLKASESLPFLNRIHSFPTMIVLDRNHKVVSVHTGFTGPATGEQYYDTFRSRYLNLIDKIVQP